MLKNDELLEAAQQAEKSAGVCTRFCRIVVSVEDGTYLCAHNGTGNRDTDSQVVHSPAIAALNKEQLATCLGAWIKKLHQGERVDLNAAMATDELSPDLSGVMAELAVMADILRRAAQAMGQSASAAVSQSQASADGLRYLVGEEGPELFTPYQPGTIIPNSRRV